MKSNVAYRVVASLLLACLATAAIGADTGPGTKQCLGDQRLTYLNSDVLDTTIESAVVTACPTIEVAITSSMPLDALSPRLDRWLVKVVRGGGQVTILPEADRPVERELSVRQLKEILELPWELYKSARAAVRERLLTAAITNYDATIYVADDGQHMTALVLTRRVPPADPASP